MRAVTSQTMSEMKRNEMMIALVIVMMMIIAVGKSVKYISLLCCSASLFALTNFFAAL